MLSCCVNCFFFESILYIDDVFISGDEGACSNCSNNNKGDDNKEIVLEEDKTVDVELKVAEDNVEKSKEN